MNRMEKINDQIEFSYQRIKRFDDYCYEIINSETSLVFKFIFSSQMGLMDMGCNDYEIVFKIHHSFFQKYAHSENNIAFTEGKYYFCSAIHQNLIMMLQANINGLYRKIFIESYIMFLIYQTQMTGNVINFTDESGIYEDHEILREKIHLVKNQIDNGCALSTSIYQICEKIGIKQDYVLHGFKKIYGKSIYIYLFELRMQKARLLYNESLKTEKEIVNTCGYTTIKTFHESFQSYYGYLPVRAMLN